MKRQRLLRFMAIAGAVFLIFNCSSPLTDTAMNVSKSVSYTIPTEPDPIGDSDSPLSVPLIAGKTTEVGTVNVWVEGETLFVSFNSDWNLTEIHLEVVTDPADFPQTKKGNPIPGQFAYKESFEPDVFQHTISIPLSNFGDAEMLFFAAHGEVQQWDDDVLLREEGAWADGYDFPGRNWATYFVGSVNTEPEILSFIGVWECEYAIEDLFGPGKDMVAGSRLIVGDGIYRSESTINDEGELIDCMHMGTYELVESDPDPTVLITVLQSDDEDHFLYTPSPGDTVIFHFYNLTATTATLAVDMNLDGTDDMSFDCIRVYPDNSAIAGTWDLEGNFTYYATFSPPTFIELTIDEVLTFNEIGTFEVSGTALVEGAGTPNVMYGVGFYEYDGTAETLVMHYLIFIMDGVSGMPPDPGLMDCYISGDEMTTIITADSDFEPYDPFTFIRG